MMTMSAKAFFIPPGPLTPTIDAGNDAIFFLNSATAQLQNVTAQMSAYVQTVNQQAKAMLSSYVGKFSGFMGGIFKKPEKQALPGTKEIKESSVADIHDVASVQEAIYKMFLQYPVDCNDTSEPDNANICNEYKKMATEFYQDTVIEVYTTVREMEKSFDLFEQSINELEEALQKGGQQGSEDNGDENGVWKNAYNAYETMNSILKVIEEIEAMRAQYVAAQAIGSRAVQPSIPSKKKEKGAALFLDEPVKMAQGKVMQSSSLHFAAMATTKGTSALEAQEMEQMSIEEGAITQENPKSPKAAGSQIKGEELESELEIEEDFSTEEDAFIGEKDEGKPETLKGALTQQAQAANQISNMEPKAAISTLGNTTEPMLMETSIPTRQISVSNTPASSKTVKSPEQINTKTSGRNISSPSINKAQTLPKTKDFENVSAPTTVAKSEEAFFESEEQEDAETDFKKTDKASLSNLTTQRYTDSVNSTRNDIVEKEAMEEDEEESKNKIRRDPSMFAPAPESGLISPYAESEKDMKLLEKISEAYNVLSEALEIHNQIKSLDGLQSVYDGYNKAVRIHAKALENLKTIEQCAINYYGYMYENPRNVWNGNLDESQLTNQEERKGISGWAVKAYNLAKAEDTGVVLETDDISELNVDMGDVDSSDLSKMDKLEESISTDSGGFKDAAKEAKVNASMKETDRLAWNIGYEAARLLVQDQASNGKNGKWGTAKVLYPVWNDVKAYYNQYLDGKYDRILKRLSMVDTNAVALELASKLNAVTGTAEEREENEQKIAQLKTKIEEDKSEIVTNIESLVTAKKERLDGVYQEKEEKLAILQKRRENVEHQLNSVQADLDELNMDLQDSNEQKLEAQETIAAMEALIETITKREQDLPSIEIMETTEKEYQKDLNAFLFDQNNILNSGYTRKETIGYAQLSFIERLKKAAGLISDEPKEATAQENHSKTETASNTQKGSEISEKEADTENEETDSEKQAIQDEEDEKNSSTKSEEVGKKGTKGRAAFSMPEELSEENTLALGEEENVSEEQEENLKNNGIPSAVGKSAGANGVSVSSSQNLNSVSSGKINMNAPSVPSRATFAGPNKGTMLQNAATLSAQQIKQNISTPSTIQEDRAKDMVIEPESSIVMPQYLSADRMTEKEPPALKADIRTYVEEVETLKTIDYEESESMIVAKATLVENQQKVLELSAKINGLKEKINNLTETQLSLKKTLEKDIPNQEKEINEQYVSEVQEITAQYDSQIEKAEENYVDELLKISNIDLVDYAQGKISLSHDLKEILGNANGLVNDARGTAEQLVNDIRSKMDELGDDLYSPQSHGTIVEYHKQLMDYLKQLPENELISFGETINRFKSYAGILNLVRSVFQSYIVEDACKDDYCYQPDTRYFVSNNGKREDFMAPKSITENLLPSVRETVFFDAEDYENIPKNRNGNITREGIIQNLSYVPEIWKLILKSPAFVEKDIDLSAVIKPSPDKFVAGGIYPCWKDDKKGDKKYLVTSDGDKYIVYGASSGSSAEDRQKHAELLNLGYRDCGDDIEISGKRYLTVKNVADDLKGSAESKSYFDFKEPTSESELGYLFDYDNGLKYNQVADKILSELIKNNEKGNSKEEQKIVLHEQSLLDKSQIGEFLRAIDFEQESRQNQSELLVELETAKQALMELLERAGLKPNNGFDLSNEKDYDLARNALLRYRNKLLSSAINLAKPLQGNKNEIIEERMVKINNIIGALQKDSEVYVNLGDMSSNNAELEEAIKSEKVNQKVASKHQKEAEEAFEKQLKQMGNVYCAELAGNM